jgi:hypothetical protein
MRVEIESMMVKKAEKCWDNAVLNIETHAELGIFIREEIQAIYNALDSGTGTLAPCPCAPVCLAIQGVPQSALCITASKALKVGAKYQRLLNQSAFTRSVKRLFFNA